MGLFSGVATMARFGMRLAALSTSVAQIFGMIDASISPGRRKGSADRWPRSTRRRAVAPPAGCQRPDASYGAATRRISPGQGRIAKRGSSVIQPRRRGKRPCRLGVAQGACHVDQPASFRGNDETMTTAKWIACLAALFALLLTNEFLRRRHKP